MSYTFYIFQQLCVAKKKQRSRYVKSLEFMNQPPKIKETYLTRKQL